MAVKVKCPTCDKVLNAPDAARGKAVKCPECETKVKVPAEGGSGRTTPRPSGPKTAKKPAPGSESTEFLAGLDFSKMVDSSSQICPKCGAEIPDDQTECPKCGVDISTGQLSAAAKKRKSRKGPDPAEYYSAAWTDSWAFMKENARVAVRTGLYLILFELAAVGSFGMFRWCATTPPKVFWLGLGVASFLVIPGWIWCLTIETIRVTAAKKRSIRDIHFDIFQNMALGIKTIIWFVVFLCWFPFVGFMYPLAMIHMAMPVTKKAWLMPAMVPVFFRNSLPTLYWWVIYVVNLLIIFAIGLLGYGIMLACFGQLYLDFLRTDELKIDSAAKWGFLATLLTFQVIMRFALGFTSLFNMRAMGLLAYYFQNSLDLVTLVSEKTYTRKKEQKFDAFGNPVKTAGQKIGGVVFVVVILGVIAGVGYLVYYQLFKKNG
jgi:ribosomal protein L40E